MAASNHVFSAFSFISFILTFIPLTWHLEAWNTGTCIYMGWIGLGSLFLFINSVVWDGNAINWAPVYCDIVTKFFIGLSVSIPAAALCINRRLYHIVRVTSVTRIVSEKRRGVFVDLGIGVGIPVLIMILHVVVQGHRFDIYEDVGCMPTIYNTPLAYALVLGPTLGLAIIACVYSVLAVLSLRRNYVQFKELLSLNGTNSVAANRYIRLMCLAGLEAVLDVPVNLYVVIAAAKNGVDPWVSWAETHFEFNRVEQIPALLWRQSPEASFSLERTRWTVVACGLIFFAFFGFADEAMRNYKIAFNFVTRKFGWRPVGAAGFLSSGYSTRGQDKANNNEKTGSGVESGKKGGLFRKNRTENWMDTFDAFAKRVKLTFLQSSGGGSTSEQSSTDVHTRDVNTMERNLPVYISTEMVQRRDPESASIFTSLTDFSYATTGSEEPSYTIHQGGPSGSKCSVILDGERADVNGDDYNLESKVSAISCSTPPPPPVPPKDIPCSTPGASLAPLPLATHLMSNRTPPRQMVPTSVSVSPSPNGSFLDLSTSELEIAPTRDTHSADNRV